MQKIARNILIRKRKVGQLMFIFQKGYWAGGELSAAFLKEIIKDKEDCNRLFNDQMANLEKDLWVAQ